MSRNRSTRRMKQKAVDRRKKNTTWLRDNPPSPIQIDLYVVLGRQGWCKKAKSEKAEEIQTPSSSVALKDSSFTKRLRVITASETEERAREKKKGGLSVNLIGVSSNQ